MSRTHQVIAVALLLVTTLLVTTLLVTTGCRSGAAPAERAAPCRSEVVRGQPPTWARAGCWRLRLSWSSHTDTIDLEYVAPS
ncbi:hypothetical protein HCN51_46440 [Nonomuraea sp. FMUSA5-5]|uniref:Secreted protein n=1 Tax=Nonomuraea composti TaxID=2720023 RepID=A0ABX1BG92_9ACTN|nr:hypothetical protein [Nonomuraea sp. FMUSA5-5]NJP96789.1 hypothetical protein [Nonomuraea sp. FMUSA5-5]